MLNRSEILTEAHAQTKRLRASGTTFSEIPYVQLFAQRLAYVWSQLKTSMAVKSAHIELTIIENKNRLTASDYTRISELRGQLAKAA